MIGLWTMLLFTSQVPELVTSPFSIAFHLAAEFVTAFFLIVGGVMLYLEHLLGVKIYLASIGMLLYTVINSSGYYAQNGEWSFVAMFAVLFVLAVTSLIGLVREGKDI
ncbi:hypothetical protein [Natranaerofaba carboxydovora]|uniref:hypothetical protein n=1 Tax=Natranaerofaba carboxydovora TaxID=2742683 RepID=UPI001F128E89|nr:hypothetical protein [Natranaerofaba carboxydovora]UMZ74417.1 hypothetical protein ACONDI_02008 [Natranaerofaba carboxydovora]